MDSIKILNFIKENNVIPKKVYNFNKETNQLEVHYQLDNSPYDCEIIREKSKKELGFDYNKLAYESFCVMNLNYEQQQQFYID